jgi:Protease inhibitor Inh
MKTLHTLLLSSFAIAAFATASQADPTGQWKMAVGTNMVCPLTLSADGTATADCATGNRVARWRAVADKLELRTASGEMVGVLYAKNGTYTGKRFSDGRTLVLSR